MSGTIWNGVQSLWAFLQVFFCWKDEADDFCKRFQICRYVVDFRRGRSVGGWFRSDPEERIFRVEIKSTKKFETFYCSCVLGNKVNICFVFQVDKLEKLVVELAGQLSEEVEKRKLIEKELSKLTDLVTQVWVLTRRLPKVPGRGCLPSGVAFWLKRRLGFQLNIKTRVNFVLSYFYTQIVLP